MERTRSRAAAAGNKGRRAPRERSFFRRHRLWLIPLATLLAILLLFLLPLLLWPGAREFVRSPEALRDLIAGYEGWALAAYVLLSIVVIVAPPLPNEIVPVVGGALFGFWTALLWALVARIIGSTINYALGTQLGRRLYHRWLDAQEKKRLGSFTKKIGWQAVFVSRFMPSTDTDLIAYLAGMARMRYWQFILASFLGMLVPVSTTILIGTSLFTNKWLFFALVGFYIVGVLVVPLLARRALARKGN